MARLQLKQQSGIVLNQNEQVELANLSRRLGNAGSGSVRQRKRNSNTSNQYLDNYGIPRRPVNYFGNRAYTGLVPVNPFPSSGPLNGNLRTAGNEAASMLSMPRMGKTAMGQAWSSAALHPCGELAPSQVGLPDTITASVVCPNYRFESEIVWDVSMFPDPPAGDSPTWSAQIVSVPVPELAYVYRIRHDATQAWSAWRAKRLPGFELAKTGPWTGTTRGITFDSVGYPKSRCVGKGLTFELNATGLNNQGRIVSGQMQLSGDIDDVTVAAFAGSGNQFVGPTEGDPVRRVISFDIPATEDTVVAVCPRAYQEEAKHGAYIVHKFDGPLTGYQFKQCGRADSYEIGATSDHPLINGPYTSMVFRTKEGNVVDPSNNPFTADSDAHFYSGSIGITGTYDKTTHPFVSQPCDMLSSVTFFLGMPLAAGTGLSPTIRVKGRQYMECLSNGSAAVAPFARPSPLRDMVAIDSVVGVMQTYDDAYPACYNGLGEIIGRIWTGMKVAYGAYNEAKRNPWVQRLRGLQGMVAKAGFGYATGGTGGVSTSDFADSNWNGPIIEEVE